MPSKQPQCRDCRAPIAWFRDAHTGGWRPFDPKPIDVRSGKQQSRPAYPVESRRAWKTNDLIEDLVVRREYSRAEAESEVYDLPWHVRHECPNNPHRSEGQEAPA